MKNESNYDITSIGQVRKKFDVVELMKKIKKREDISNLSNQLKIKPRIFYSIVYEGRILSLFPNLEKSKTSILSRLRTEREIRFFSQKYNIYSLSVRNLIKVVRKWNQDIQKDPFLLITQKEHDLILGSLLGDASIRQREKNSCFRISHSIKQRDYIKWKLNILKSFNISEFRETTRKIKNHFIKVINLATKTHSVFNYYRILFYKNNRKMITKEILNHLSPSSLAVWICDDGSYNNKQNYIILCTNSYSLKEHELMKQFFKEKFKLDPTIGFRDGKYHYLRFKQKDSKKLIKIIKPFIPKSMLYKIGEMKNAC